MNSGASVGGNNYSPARVIKNLLVRRVIRALFLFILRHSVIYCEYDGDKKRECKLKKLRIHYIEKAFADEITISLDTNLINIQTNVYFKIRKTW